jgi:UDP-N-acetylmuramoyl-L-alanyl-D-glutamate--2,6-diaminopimelate ligase
MSLNLNLNLNLRVVLGEQWPDIEVTGLCEHTTEVFQGCAFFAVALDPVAAKQHADDALNDGAKLVISQHRLEREDCYAYPELLAERGVLAATFYGNPGEQMQCIGVTGTNGKTSVAYYIASLSDLLRVPCGYIGTLGWGRLDELVDPNMTTPNPTALQRMLATLRENGCRRVAIEVSSHALHQHRAHAVPFTAGIFTNLSREHLDYHHTMESYLAAKMQLFTEFPLRSAILFDQDPLSHTIEEQCDAEVLRYGRGPVKDSTETCTWSIDAPSEFGPEVIEWQIANQRIRARVLMVADFAIDNLTAAIAVLVTFEHEGREIQRVLPDVASVPGRMQIVVRSGAHGTIVVDYAHTPDALEKVLSALIPKGKGRLICVVGCGGDRDQGKRPQMAATAAKHADVVWLTSDNPRSEDPLRIIHDMQCGVQESDVRIELNADRREAICDAIKQAEVQDVVLIAGKGHERYQEIKGQKYPFDDVAIAKAALVGV